jgi:hypothetical protein
MNTNSAITWQLMRTARMIEAECRQVMLGRVGTGAKKDQLSTGRVLVAGFHHVTVRSRLEGFLKVDGGCLRIGECLS